MIALHVLAIVLVVVMANLSAWQFGRLDDRRAFNEQVRSRARMPATAIADLIGLSPDEVEWRPVVVRGTFRPEDEVIVLNRSQNNTAGVDALTPLELTIEGRNFVVLVDRGFVPLSAEIPPPPSGDVEFLARARKSQERRLGGLTDPAQGVVREVQRVDVERLADQMKSSAEQTILPFYVDYVASLAGADDIVDGIANVAGPELTEGTHLSYAIQWIIFALCAIVAWFILVRRALRSRPSA
jgi:cytochrome oxidase assembly protein ShyY1